MHRYWRFQLPDGTIDYFDENGQNSRKFLIKVPIKMIDPRLTSGYGFRTHPTLNVRRMHTGVDWAAPSGTPIIAAGSGVIEELGWKGHFSYGHYIRIRHANGYQTAYGHLSRYAPGLREGSRVTQGQLIGFVGSTGQSTAPHLHYEVIVGDNFVDPMSLKSPQARILAGADAIAFRKERRRIEELSRRPPVRIEHLDAR
ncbi:MAG TPA: M23 family metallopeptidase [Hyphomicrobiaceae bacterium]|nr:M23 family metallopeptidase [Hyphomicrobiaceae bacterium]